MPLVYRLEGLTVSGIAEVRPASEGTPLPGRAPPVDPEGAEGLLGIPGARRGLARIGRLETGSIETVIGSEEITAVAAGPAGSSERAHLRVRIAIDRSDGAA